MVLDLLDMQKQKTNIDKKNPKLHIFEINSKWVIDFKCTAQSQRTFLDLTPKA